MKQPKTIRLRIPPPVTVGFAQHTKAKANNDGEVLPRKMAAH
jgi:hypothetical protein